MQHEFQMAYDWSRQDPNGRMAQDRKGREKIDQELDVSRRVVDDEDARDAHAVVRSRCSRISAEISLTLIGFDW